MLTLVEFLGELGDDAANLDERIMLLERLRSVDSLRRGYYQDMISECLVLTRILDDVSVRSKQIVVLLKLNLFVFRFSTCQTQN